MAVASDDLDIVMITDDYEETDTELPIATEPKQVPTHQCRNHWRTAVVLPDTVACASTFEWAVVGHRIDRTGLDRDPNSCGVELGRGVRAILFTIVHVVCGVCVCSQSQCTCTRVVVGLL
jgi:hypothetical protein